MSDSIRSGFQRALNAHGYGFHAAVGRELHRLNRSDQSGFAVATAEFPVLVRGVASRIDLVLEGSSRRWFMAVECKRVDPAIANWCFIASRTLGGRPHDNALHFDTFATQHGEMYCEPKVCGHVESVAHVGLEVRGAERGDGTNSGRNDIENALSQACRGANGLIDYFAANPQYFKRGSRLVVVPLVVTTARLWLSSANLDAATLDVGHVDLAREGFGSVGWLALQYRQSPGIRHSIRFGLLDEDIAQGADLHAKRTVLVANPTGLSDLFDRASYWSAG